MSAAGVSPKFETKDADTTGAALLSVALIGPDAKRRSLVARALAETRRADVREFDSYPPKREHLQGLLASFDVVVLDLDSDPNVALELVERASAGNAAAIVVYSENADPKFAIRFMRAGAREYLLCPSSKAQWPRLWFGPRPPLARNLFPRGIPEEGCTFLSGPKGDPALPRSPAMLPSPWRRIPAKAFCSSTSLFPLGTLRCAWGLPRVTPLRTHFRNIDRLDASSLHDLLVKHRSGVFVLAAPTKVPDVEVSEGAIDKLIAIARREFDHVIVDVGSRIDVAAKVLFEDASTIYLVTQTGISELRNSNRLISQFFAEGSPNLEVVINRFESRFLEPANEDVIAKALGRPVRWKIPDDQDAARALQTGDSGLPETRISRLSLEMAGSITGRPIAQENKRDFDVGGLGDNMPQVDFARYETMSPAILASADARSNPTITWPAPASITYGNKLTFDQLNATASLRERWSSRPALAMCCPSAPTRCGSRSLRRIPATTFRSRPRSQSWWPKATPALSWPVRQNRLRRTVGRRATQRLRVGTEEDWITSPAPGELLPPGLHTLTVTFTPADTANYTTAKATVSLLVAKAISEIQWPRPNPISYGTRLSPLQLCAMASVPGTFEYNPGLGAVLAAGEHQLSVVFTPRRYRGLLYFAGGRISHRGQGKSSHHLAYAGSNYLRRRPHPIRLNPKASVPGSFAFRPAAGEIPAPEVMSSH